MGPFVALHLQFKKQHLSFFSSNRVEFFKANNAPNELKTFDAIKLSESGPIDTAVSLVASSE
jgi:hypothetical protein